MLCDEKLDKSYIQPYRKLYFVWYFDDDEGYGIEVFGERITENCGPAKTEGSRFFSVVNWTFGHGVEARDLRRAWGEYVANMTKENCGVIPPDIVCIQLRYKPEKHQITGDSGRIIELLQFHLISRS